jgi:hypothetical protein
VKRQSTEWEKTFANHTSEKELQPKYITNQIARCQWLTPVILATQEAEVRRIMV